MRKTLTWLGVLALGAVLQGGLSGRAVAQGPAPGSSAANPAPGYGGSVPDQAVRTLPHRLKRSRLPSCRFSMSPASRSCALRSNPNSIIVRVTGLTGSQGWNSPELVPTFVGKPLDGILDLQFIATDAVADRGGNRFCTDRRRLHARGGPCIQRGAGPRLGKHDRSRSDPRQQSREDHGRRLQGLRRQEIR